MYVDLTLPPGLFANGTERQAAGRYFDANMVRFFEDAIRPIGGWRRLGTGVVTGKARNIIATRANNGNLWGMVGTHTGLFTLTEGGVVTNVTPAAYTSGRENSENGGGYGAGAYGVGTYGTPRTTDDILSPANWTLTPWGENIIACGHDEVVVEWTPGTTEALPVANAPSATAVVTSGQRFLFALGANGDPRRVSWSDQENNTLWQAAPDNQAGGIRIESKGRLRSGIATPGGVLMFTETDAHTARYIGGTFVYEVERAGDGCGIIAPNAAVEIDGEVVWMGHESFWIFREYLRPLKCEVAGRVFDNLNRLQAGKIKAHHNAAFGEVWWLYPSSGSFENDRYVIYNYREGHWATGRLDRGCMIDSAPFRYPLGVGHDGALYEHEVGLDHGGADVFLQSGPFELNTDEDGLGGRSVSIMSFIPDERTLGATTLTIKSRQYPNGPETVTGPFPAAAKTDMRVNARQHSMRLDAQDGIDWRVGRPRVDIRLSGRR